MRRTTAGDGNAAPCHGAEARKGRRASAALNGAALVLVAACCIEQGAAETFRGGPAPATATAMLEARGTTGASAARALGRGGVTGLPLPRFASIRSSPVNVRKGPGTDYPLALVYQRAGLPIEIVQEFEGWRQVRDWDGATGWVLGALLSGRRTAIVEPWPERRHAGRGGLVPLLEGRSLAAGVVAQLEPGAVAGVKSCDGRWCDVAVASYRGYVEQRRLWGVYPGERVR
ncbi:MAG: SH3 domain-containing protein [Hyphomicrobiaceae bacterium]